MADASGDKAPPADRQIAPITPPLRSSKPVSEALLNDKVSNGFLLSLGKVLLMEFILEWDHAISSLLVRSTVGLSFGVVLSVLLFKRRAWPAFVGLGFGAGRAWEEADGELGTPTAFLSIG